MNFAGNSGDTRLNSRASAGTTEPRGAAPALTQGPKRDEGKQGQVMNSAGNRLVNMTNPSYTAAYTYAADGLRLRVQESNNPNPDRWMQYDGVRPVLEGTLSGDTFTTVNKYVWEGNSYYEGVIPGTHTLIPDKRGHDRASWRSARANARPQAGCVAIAEENDSRGTRRRGGAACKVNGQKRVAVVWILLHNRCESGKGASPEPRFHAPRSALNDRFEGTSHAQKGLCSSLRLAAALFPIFTAGCFASADVGRTLPDVPRFKLFASSHSTAAAKIMAYYGVKKGLHTGRAGRRVTREFQHHPATRSRHE